MYNGIPLWKKMGSSMGKVLLKPDKEIYDYWNHWLKENHKELYQNSVVGKSSPKQKTLATLFRILGLKISDYYVNQNRGVYYSSFYKNARDFLCNQIPIEELIVDERFNDDYIMKWWKPKAINRFKKLEKSNKLQTADLWYEDMDKELENFKSWLMSRGKKYYSIKNNMVSSDSVDKMFNKAGIDKTKLYKCLITMGRAGLKTKKMKEEWSKENPTRNYCYTVSEFIYKYVAPKGVKHYSVKVEGEDLSHHYLKWTDGSIVDLTAEQFSDYSKVDYSKGYSSGFIGKGVSKRTKEFARLMGYN